MEARRRSIRGGAMSKPETTRRFSGGARTLGPSSQRRRAGSGRLRRYLLELQLLGEGCFAITSLSLPVTNRVRDQAVSVREISRTGEAGRVVLQWVVLSGHLDV